MGQGKDMTPRLIRIKEFAPGVWEVSAMRWDPHYHRWFFAYGATAFSVRDAVDKFRIQYGPCVWAMEAG